MKPTKKTSKVLNFILPFIAKSMPCGDLTGAFPCTSSRGSKYLYLTYDYDDITILVIPSKIWQAQDIETFGYIHPTETGILLLCSKTSR